MTKCEEVITQFLMDGMATGRVKCTLANWTGVAYKIPRTKLDDFKERDDLKQCGVYFLFGISEKKEGKDTAYIGQAKARNNGEGVLYRIQEHKNDDDWKEAVALIATDNSLTATEISYLENRFFNLAKEVDRYDVKNKVEPCSGNVTEEDKTVLEKFIENAKIVMSSLGYRIFDSLDEKSTDKEKEDKNSIAEPLLYLKTGKVDAKGRSKNEGFVVYEGATVSDQPTPSCLDYIRKLRDKHAGRIKEGKIIEDILFNSPSAAAGFLIYSNANGMEMWKDENGRTLNQIENN
ncbi:MAG: GIY-YIG nuclease family protein [Candidatus Cloacimonetes bacterium]|nr:GIY-YIG nuclease family protein [Candidatus Cloacimonadota bacterium]